MLILADQIQNDMKRILFLLALALVSCQDDGGSGVDAAHVAGSWEIVGKKVNGTMIPYVNKCDATPDVYTFVADGTFSIDLRNTDCTTFSADNGHWALNGNVLHALDPDPAAYLDGVFKVDYHNGYELWLMKEVVPVEGEPRTEFYYLERAQ